MPYNVIESFNIGVFLMEENKNNHQQDKNESQESSSDIKTTVIKCISLVCCVALVAVTLGK